MVWGGGNGHHFKWKALHCIEFFCALHVQVSSKAYSAIVCRGVVGGINIWVGNGHHFKVKALHCLNFFDGAALTFGVGRGSGGNSVCSLKIFGSLRAHFSSV